MTVQAISSGTLQPTQNTQHGQMVRKGGGHHHHKKTAGTSQTPKSDNAQNPAQNTAFSGTTQNQPDSTSPILDILA
jgi:hypothetical protein